MVMDLGVRHLWNITIECKFYRGGACIFSNKPNKDDL
jgi:hypothetical protein